MNFMSQTAVQDVTAMDTDATLVGPSLMGIGAKYDATYLKDAILNPDKNVPEGFTAGVMPPFTMPDADADEIINYLSNTDKGKELFESNGCAGCHAIDTEAVLVGPSLKVLVQNMMPHTLKMR